MKLSDKPGLALCRGYRRLIPQAGRVKEGTRNPGLDCQEPPYKDMLYMRANLYTFCYNEFIWIAKEVYHAENCGPDPG